MTLPYLIAAALIAVAFFGVAYTYHRYRMPLALSPGELRPKTIGPSHSGQPAAFAPAITNNTAPDAKACTPKILSFGKTAREIHLRSNEKPTGRIPVVAFQILESGAVVNVVLKQSSGIRDKDNAALDWVKGTKYNSRSGCGIVESQVGVTIDLAPE